MESKLKPQQAIFKTENDVLFLKFLFFFKYKRKLDLYYQLLYEGWAPCHWKYTSQNRSPLQRVLCWARGQAGSSLRGLQTSGSPSVAPKGYSFMSLQELCVQHWLIPVEWASEWEIHRWGRCVEISWHARWPSSHVWSFLATWSIPPEMASAGDHGWQRHLQITDTGQAIGQVVLCLSFPIWKAKMNRVVVRPMDYLGARSSCSFTPIS